MTAHHLNIVVLTAKMANVAINVPKIQVALLGNVVVMIINVDPVTKRIF